MRPGAREWLLRMVLAGSSLLLLFGLGEIVARLFFPDRHLRYENDPHALWYWRPNQVGYFKLGDGSLSPPVRINSLGLRGKEPGLNRGLRILFLGDSFTFGTGVKDHETFPALLDSAFQGRGSVINGGQGGYGVFQMAAALERLGRWLEPDLVVVVIWQGDFLRQPPSEEERERVFRRKRQIELVKRSVLVTHLYRAIEPLLVRMGAGRFVLLVGEGTQAPATSADVVIASHLGGLKADLPRILAMHAEARRYGKGVFLVLWPKEGYAVLRPQEQGLAQHLTDSLSEFAKQHHIPFVSLQPVLAPYPKTSLVIPGDGHPTAVAHCLVAGFLAGKLRELGFAVADRVPCTPGSPAH